MTKPNKYGCRVDDDVCIVHDQPLICKHGCSEQKVKCNCKITDYYGEEFNRWDCKDGDEVWDKCFTPYKDKP